MHISKQKSIWCEAIVVSHILNPWFSTTSKKVWWST